MCTLSAIDDTLSPSTSLHTDFRGSTQKDEKQSLNDLNISSDVSNVIANTSVENVCSMTGSCEEKDLIQSTVDTCVHVYGADVCDSNSPQKGCDKISTSAENLSSTYEKISTSHDKLSVSADSAFLEPVNGKIDFKQTSRSYGVVCMETEV